MNSLVLLLNLLYLLWLYEIVNDDKLYNEKSLKRIMHAKTPVEVLPIVVCIVNVTSVFFTL